MAPMENIGSPRDIVADGSLMLASSAATGIKTEDGFNQKPVIKTEDEPEQKPRIKTEDDLKQEPAIPPMREWPVVKRQCAASSTITLSPTLMALIRQAVGIRIDDAWEKEEDKGGDHYRVNQDRMEEFNDLIKQAANEIVRAIWSYERAQLTKKKPLVCKALGLDLNVAIDYVAHIRRAPPDVSLTAKHNIFAVVPFVKDGSPDLKVTINERGHRPTEDDEVHWPSTLEEYDAYLVGQQKRMIALDGSIIFLSIIYDSEGVHAKAESSGS